MNSPTMPTAAMQGEAASLDGTIGVPLFVSPDQDLAAKPGSDQDSWFVISHLESARGTLDLLIHFLYVKSPAGPMVLAMYSLLDPETKRYLNQEVAHPAPACTLSHEALDVRTPNGTVGGTAADMRVTASFDTVQAELRLSHTGPTLANVGAGIMPALGDLNFEYAFPSMATTGRVTIDGTAYDVEGESWFDRQWGMTPRFFGPGTRKWIWFGTSLDNGDRLSIWDIAEGGRQHAFATVLHPDGGHEVVAVEPIEEGASKHWTSPATGRVYPIKWQIRIPQLQAVLDVEPETIEQEIVSQAGAHKYEGASPVRGSMRGNAVSGRAVIELVGDWV